MASRSLEQRFAERRQDAVSAMRVVGFDVADVADVAAVGIGCCRL